MFEYRGSLHIHSTFSDGSGTIPEIVEQAKGTGVDFIGITDHETLEARRQGFEGYHGDLMVLIGAELNKSKNHYIAFNIQEEVADFSEKPQQTIDAVKSQGGVGFLAHPFERGSRLVMNGIAYPWTDWKVKDFDGLEIWNLCSQWRNIAGSRLKLLYAYYLRRNAPVSIGPPAKLLRKWDELTMQRPVSALGGTDAHAIPLKFGPMRAVFLPYDYLFKTIGTHVLLPKRLAGDFETAKQQILKALKTGSSFIANNSIRLAKGFRFTAFNCRKEVGMGEEIRCDRFVSLKIISPDPRSLIRIIKNGKVVRRSKRDMLVFKVLEPGVFRIEVFYRPRIGPLQPWIYSNPIYIR